MLVSVTTIACVGLWHSFVVIVPPSSLDGTTIIMLDRLVLVVLLGLWLLFQFGFFLHIFIKVSKLAEIISFLLLLTRAFINTNPTLFKNQTAPSGVYVVNDAIPAKFHFANFLFFLQKRFKKKKNPVST